MKYWFYLELSSVSDVVEETAAFNGVARQIINDATMCIDNNVPELYPDFVFETSNPEPECCVNGDPATPQPLLNGYRPAHRPPQRPR